MSSRYTDKVALTGGYAFLVEKEINYKIRLNDPAATLPKPQTKPVEPTVDTSTVMKKFYSDMRSFRLQHNCNLDVRALLDEKFPGILNPLKHSKVGTFTSVLTARDAFDYVEKAVGSTAVSNKKSLDHIRAVLDRKYTPEQSGAEIYFTLCETDMYQVEGAGISYIPKSTMMMAAQHAFRQAINKDKAQQIDNDWESAHDLLLLAKTSTDVVYEKFKEHYTKHLKDWTRNMGDTPPPAGKANVLTEHTNELVDLRETLRHVVDSQNHLQEQYANRAELDYNQYRPPPSVVTAPTTTTVSTTANSVANSVAPTPVYPDFEGILQRALQTQAAITEKAIANSRPSNPRNAQSTRTTPQHGPRRRTGTGTWRQWKYWCYTCGVNLKHNTNDCDRNRKLANHYTSPSATKANPQGGNTSRDDLWLQWCHPVTNAPQPTKGDPA